MSTPTQSEALAAAMAAQSALTDAANALFIANATNVINDLISQGKYEVFLNHVKHVSFKDISTYFRGLGYTTGVPTCPSWEFGYFYGQYWTGWEWGWWRDRQICGCGTPCKILISWQGPASGNCGPVPWPGNCF